jgi:hypothetical protein
MKQKKTAAAETSRDASTAVLLMQRAGRQEAMEHGVGLQRCECRRFVTAATYRRVRVGVVLLVPTGRMTVDQPRSPRRFARASVRQRC